MSVENMVNTIKKIHQLTLKSYKNALKSKIGGKHKAKLT